MNIKDETVGQNLAKLRKRSSLTQEELAARMRARGHSWTKMTVYNVERGDRQLRLVEASDVLTCLGYDSQTDLPRLLMNEQEAVIVEAIDQLKVAISGINVRCHDIYRVRYYLEHVLDQDEDELPKGGKFMPVSEETKEAIMQALEKSETSEIMEQVKNNLGSPEDNINLPSQEEMESYLLSMQDDVIEYHIPESRYPTHARRHR